MTAYAQRKPRLLVLASTYPRWAGDPEPGFVHALARGLKGRFDITVLCPHAPGAAPSEVLDGIRVYRYRYAPARLETLVNDGGIVTNLRRSSWKWLLLPTFVLALLWHAWRLARLWQPDVVHAHWLLPQGLAWALLGRFTAMAPFVVTSHGADLFALKARPLQALKRNVVRRAAAITVVSTAMRDELARIGARTDKVTVQPMGVDLRCRFTPDPATPRSRDELLFVGRLVEKKGLQYLIDAMPAVLAARPSAFLTVAGFGPELSARQSQVARLGLGDKVYFAGAVSQSQLPGLYRRAAVFVAPFVQAASGDQEGLGLVLVEALGCGCPVVTTRLPAIAEVFDGTPPAALAEPASATDLAVHVLKALQDPEAAAASVEYAKPALYARFDHANVASGYAALLMSVMEKHNGYAAARLK
jgi:glycosyltransferase involved in cell wall biosynthesis